MRIGRLRTGELLVLTGLVAVVVSLFLRWFSLGQDAICRAVVGAGTTPGLSPETCAILTRARGVPGGVAPADTTLGLTALGHPWLELVVLFAVGLAAVLITAQRAAPGRPTFAALAALAVTGIGGPLLLAATAVRTLLARPTTDARIVVEPALRVDGIGVGVGPGTWVALAGMLVAVAGIWIALRDERPDASDSAYAPPAPRAAPAPRGPAPPSSIEPA